MAYLPRKNHNPGTRLRNQVRALSRVGGTSRSAVAVGVLRPVRPLLPRVPPGMLPGLGIATGLWGAWNWYLQSGYEQFTTETILTGWKMAGECLDGGPTPGLTYTISNQRVTARTGNAISVLCAGTFANVGYLGEPWPPASYLNDPKKLSFTRQWTFQRNFQNGTTDQRGKYKEAWVRETNEEASFGRLGPPPLVQIGPPGIAPGVGPRDGLVGAPPYIFPLVPSTIKRGTGVKPRTGLTQVIVVITPTRVDVYPEDGGREHRPPKKKVREHKLRGSRVATLVFALWEMASDWVDFIEILARNSGFVPKPGRIDPFTKQEVGKIPVRLQMIAHLADRNSWANMDWASVAQDGLGWAIDEWLAGRVYGAAGDRFADMLGRRIKLGSDIVLDPLYEAALGSELAEWMFDTVAILAEQDRKN